jgi:hypothetical protein
LFCSTKERATIHEDGIPLPPQPSYGRLKKGSDDETTKMQPILVLGRSGKPISQGKKEKNTKRRIKTRHS